jgi:hypothetical protein
LQENLYQVEDDRQARSNLGLTNKNKSLAHPSKFRAKDLRTCPDNKVSSEMKVAIAASGETPLEASDGWEGSV